MKRTSLLRAISLSAFLFVLLAVQNTWAKDRPNFYQRLEPRGNFILHGAGQANLADFLEYSNALPANERPVIYMDYVNLEEDIPTWGEQLIHDLNAAGSGWVIPQIGLAMADDAQLGKHHFEAEVAAGKFDRQIKQFVAVLLKLNRPAFVRIG